MSKPKPHRKFILLIGLVPKGNVATYGQIAKLAGCPGHSRQVVWTLHSSSRKRRLPWHRVINSKGRIGLAGAAFERQKSLLQKEGIVFDENDRIDLKAFSWAPKIRPLKTKLRELLADEAST